MARPRVTSLISSGVIFVDDLINRWSNELEQYDVLNPEVQMRMCVERFCSASLSPLDALNAGNVCYEYDDNRGCLEELCGSLGWIKLTSDLDSEEHFMAVKCRQNFFDPDPNFPTSPSGTVCHEKYAECLIDKKKFDPAVIRCHAETFRTETLKQKLSAFIEETYAEFSVREAENVQPPGRVTFRALHVAPQDIIWNRTLFSKS